MSRGKAKKRVGPLQALHDREQGEEAGAPLVSTFTEQHGVYARNLRFVQNNGCTTVKRWETAGLMSASQLAAIAHCIRLWEAAESVRGLVADMDRMRGVDSAGDGLRQQEALDALAAIKHYIPRPYYEIFENVVRFDEPGGYAGSRLADVPRAGMARVRTIVQFAADVIVMHERLSY